LTALQAFEAAARHLSFKHAAAELSLTPTAISHQVRRLEERLGTRLFVRGTRRVDLTPAGQALYAVLRHGFDAMARAVESLAPDARQRSVVLSTTMAFAARWLMPRLARFADAHPGIALQLHTSDEPVDLHGGVAQLAIRYGPGRATGLESVPLLASRFAPVCAPRLPVRSPEDLVSVPLIGYRWLRRDADTPDWPLWLERAGLPQLPRQLGFSDEANAIQAAIAGQGVALVNLAMVADALEGGLLHQPFGPVLPGHAFHVAWARTAELQPEVAAVRDWLVAEARGGA
jgi:LysR family glycine cleavage system transcriptional activator